MKRPSYLFTLFNIEINLLELIFLPSKILTFAGAPANVALRSSAETPGLSAISYWNLGF